MDTRVMGIRMGGVQENGWQGDGHRHGECRRMDTRVMGTLMGRVQENGWQGDGHHHGGGVDAGGWVPG